MVNFKTCLHKFFFTEVLLVLYFDLNPLKRPDEVKANTEIVISTAQTVSSILITCFSYQASLPAVTQSVQTAPSKSMKRKCCTL